MTELRGDSAAGDQPQQHPPVPANLDFSNTGDAARGGDVIASGGRGDTDATLLRMPSDSMGSLPRVPGVTLMREIGRGGMGVVYLGKQAFLDRQVAVKLLSDKRQSPEFLARFQREAKILAGLTHEHIVSCYQSDITPDGQCFLVMEYVDGPNLLQWIEQNGPLAVDDALAICRDVARALGYADRGKIIHRDVKPENVLLSRDNKLPADTRFPFKAKLTDLGLARPMDDESTKMNLTLDGAVMGTPASMAPEQFDDPQNVDFRADIYGLGCVFFHALTGQPPFPQRQLTTLIMAKKASPNGPNPRAKRPQVSDGVAQLCMHMLALAPTDRPQSYDEIARRCDQLMGKQIEANPRAAWIKRTAIAAAAIVVIGLGAWFAIGGGKPSVVKHEDKPAPTDVKLAALVAPVKAAKEGELVTLDGSLSDPSGLHGFTYAWKQLEGAHVELVSAAAPVATFRAPQAKQPYDLAFVLTTSRGAESANSALVQVHVEASDQAPTLTSEPVPPVDEGSVLTLRAEAIDADGDAIESFAWTQVGGPKVELANATTNAVTFVTPDAGADYALDFEVIATAASRSSLPVRVRADVRAVNQPPRVVLSALRPVEVGDRIVLAATVDDPEQSPSLHYKWTQVSGEPTATIEGADKLQAFVTAPEFSADYTLEFELAVADGALLPTTQRATVAVTYNAALTPVKRGTMRQWISAAKEFSVEQENAKPDDWSVSGAPLTFAHNGDGWLIVKSKDGAGALVRDLPRGSYELAGLLESQGAKTKATKACGVRLSYDETHALALCIVSDAAGARTLVTYATEKSGDDGAWSPPANTTFLGKWLDNESLAFVLAWTGRELHVRYGKRVNMMRSEHVVELPSRPLKLALFVDTGQCAVYDWKIAGL